MPFLKDPQDKDSRFKKKKIIQKCLYAHLENNRLIADTQNGYRSHHGVTTTMRQLAERKACKGCMIEAPIIVTQKWSPAEAAAVL